MTYDLSGSLLSYLTHPAVILGAAAAFVLGSLAHDAAQALVARLCGDVTPVRSGRTGVSLRRSVTPYGLLSMIVAGFGWVEEVPLAGTRWARARRPVRTVSALLAGPVAYLIVALAFFAVARAGDPAGHTPSSGEPFGIQFLLTGAWTAAALCVLSLVPLPPLDGGRIMFALAPPTSGWQQARYQLEDRNIGVAVILAIVFLPLVFPGFPSLVGVLGRALAGGLAGVVGLP